MNSWCVCGERWIPYTPTPLPFWPPYIFYIQFSSVVQSCPTPGDPTDYSTLSLPVHCQLPEFLHTHVQWVSDAIQRSHPLSPHSPDLNLSQREDLFQWVGSSHQWPKYWSFNFSISPYNEYSGLISFRIDWFDLLYSPRDSPESSPAPQFESINFLVFLQCSAFFMVQVSRLYMTSGKTIALTRLTG